jgi:hypothetical protein
VALQKYAAVAKSAFSFQTTLFAAIRRSKSRLLRRAIGTLLALIVSAACPANADDPLVDGFLNPPPSAKPRVWWHWMNGNVTRAGVKLDLEWMQRIGIGGFQNFDAALNTPHLVDHPLDYMTPDWWDTFKYAISLADELGLEASIAGSPGWSESGGPWVKPQEAMKKFVWTESVVHGGRRFTGQLPAPSSVTGPFQNVQFFDAAAALASRKVAKPPEFYADISVFAYRMPDRDVSAADLNPTMSSSGGPINFALLGDGDLDRGVELPIAPFGEKSWVKFEFHRPETMSSITLALRQPQMPFPQLAGRLPPPAELEASDDGEHFRLVSVIPNGEPAQHTVSFAPVNAKFFRVSLTTPPRADPNAPAFDFAGLGYSLPPPPATYTITELALHSIARINQYEEKAGFGVLYDAQSVPTPKLDYRDAVETKDVLDLTSKMRPDGVLDWAAPKGRWAVVRMGYSLTGMANHPASESGTGLEVDKLSGAHVKAYMQQYLARYQSALGTLMGAHGLRCMVNDSWEAGTQNWTEDLVQQFARRRGYDMHVWFPVLTGRVVGSSEKSERFLWDFRRTLSDLVAENHYDQISAILHEHKMCHYAESHESGRAFIGDGMDAKRSADVPMGAMWTQVPGTNLDMPGYNADVQESASVADIYGQNIAAAESLTSGVAPWGWAPETLKPTADKELAMGLNRFVIHTSVHQPFLDKGPGIGLGPVGQWFTRNDTWAEQARPWVTYLSRSSFMLQQGRFVADIAYFYGEDSNVTARFGAGGPDIPAGYHFDFFSADALTRHLSVDNGVLVTPSGMRYRALVLDPAARRMSIEILRKIHELVIAGATVIGPKPTEIAGLAGNDADFNHMADELWGSGSGLKSTGAGVVYTDAPLGTVLKAMNLQPDFEYAGTAGSQPELLFVHRKLPDGDLYWVDNRKARNEKFVGSFRVTGREAELWRADTGSMGPASFSMHANATSVPLELEPWGTVFVVFRKPTAAKSRDILPRISVPLATIEGAWQVEFQADRGAPPSASFNQLKSWSENADVGIKYFSGTASYKKTVRVFKAWQARDARIWIDLGDVRNVAELIVNGRSAGIAWHPPFQLDATDLLHAGLNDIEIRVTNLWVNRLIGDRQANASRKYTFTSPEPYNADSPLVPSGLIGPVTFLRASSR